MQDNFCPIIFGRPFLSTCGAIIDCKKGKVSVEFNGEPYEFNFSKFSKQPRGTDFSSNEKIIEEIASIAIPPDDTLQQFMEDHENDMRMQERNELEDIFLRQPAILKHNLPVEPLRILSQPKEDPVFDLKPLPIRSSMLIYMKRKYILLLSILTFQRMNKSDYWRHSADTEVLLAILLMISRVLVHLFSNILSISSPMLNQLFTINDG